MWPVMGLRLFPSRLAALASGHFIPIRVEPFASAPAARPIPPARQSVRYLVAYLLVACGLRSEPRYRRESPFASQFYRLIFPFHVKRSSKTPSRTDAPDDTGP